MKSFKDNEVFLDEIFDVFKNDFDVRGIYQSWIDRGGRHSTGNSEPDLEKRPKLEEERMSTRHQRKKQDPQLNLEVAEKIIKQALEKHRLRERDFRCVELLATELSKHMSYIIGQFRDINKVRTEKRSALLQESSDAKINLREMERIGKEKSGSKTKEASSNDAITAAVGNAKKREVVSKSDFGGDQRVPNLFTTNELMAILDRIPLYGRLCFQLRL